MARASEGTVHQRLLDVEQAFVKQYRLHPSGGTCVQGLWGSTEWGFSKSAVPDMRYPSVAELL